MQLQEPGHNTDNNAHLDVKNTGYYTISLVARKSAAPGEAQRNGHKNNKAQHNSFLLLRGYWNHITKKKKKNAQS
eukprot:13114314-Ditylum_brightwellii.AAC.1